MGKDIVHREHVHLHTLVKGSVGEGNVGSLMLQ